VPRPMCLGPHPLLHIPPYQADQRDPMEYRWDWGRKGALKQALILANPELAPVSLDTQLSEGTEEGRA
jgi:hypothetical protein